MWVQDLRPELGQGVGSRPKDRAGAGEGFGHQDRACMLKQ